MGLSGLFCRGLGGRYWFLWLLVAVPLGWGCQLVLIANKCVHNSSVHLLYIGAEEVGSQWYVYTC